MLNGTWDRETNGFSASCFVTAITDALNRTYGEPSNRLQNLVSENSSQFSIFFSFFQNKTFDSRDSLSEMLLYFA